MDAVELISLIHSLLPHRIAQLSQLGVFVVNQGVIPLLKGPLFGHSCDAVGLDAMLAAQPDAGEQEPIVVGVLDLRFQSSWGQGFESPVVSSSGNRIIGSREFASQYMKLWPVSHKRGYGIQSIRTNSVYFFDLGPHH